MANIDIGQVTRDISEFDYDELLNMTEDIFLLYETKLVDQNNPFSLKALTLATFVKHKIMKKNWRVRMFKKEKTAKVQDANSFWAEQKSKRAVNPSKFQSVYNKTIRVTYSNSPNNNQDIFKGKVLLWN